FMRMTVFRFLELAKEFLIHKNLQRNSLLKETLLLDELNFRELNNLTIKSVKELEKIIEKKTVKDADFYFAKYRMEYFRNDVKARDTKFLTYKDTLDEHLMLEQEYLNIFFFTNSLRFFQYFLNQKNFVVNAGGYPEFMNNILEYLKSHDEYLKVKVLKVYFCLVLLLINKDDKYFFDLKKILFEDKGELSYVVKFDLIAVLRNYGQEKLNKGNEEFVNIIFDILKFSIDKNLLTPSQDGKYISETRFMNIVWSGLTANELDWTQAFIKKYINRVESGKREYVYAYNAARLEFEKANYPAALEKLGKSGPIKNIFYKAAVKHLTLMIYYELKWLIPASDLMDAYKHFIRTDKLLPDMYKTHINLFLNYYNRLLKINDKAENYIFELSELIAELKTTSQGWLLKKAKELE
ncbi:MAG: hypothetical protein ABI792_07520, partial [bacterium]